MFQYEWSDLLPGRDFAASPADDTTPINSHELTRVDVNTEIAPEPSPPDPRIYRALFTVSIAVQKVTRRKRVFVRFVGRAIQSPSAWMCSACSDQRCAHIVASQQRLRHLALAPEEAEGEDPFVPRQYFALYEFRQMQPELERHSERSVSRFARPPIPFTLPPESRVTSDIDYGKIALLRLSREPGPMDQPERTACRCGAEADDLTTVMVQPCIIYDMDRAYATQIELYRCPTCDKFSAGPDLGNLSLFNFDNRTLFTHRLIHKYDVYYSGQEGTFAAFAELLNYEYEAKNSKPLSFVRVDLFRCIWFSYVRLQEWGDNMVCPICREHPYGIIADGVTVATQCSKATGHILPPTVSHADAPVRQEVRPASRGRGIQLVPYRRLRKRCIDLIDRVLKHAAGDDHPRKRRKLVAKGKDDWQLVNDEDRDEDDDVLAFVDLLHAGSEQRRTGSASPLALKEAARLEAELLVKQDESFEAVASPLQFFVGTAPPSAWRDRWLRLLRQVPSPQLRLHIRVLI